MNCVACQHEIDDAAKICPYCSSDPRTGEKLVDTQAILQEVFKPKTRPRGGTLIDYARQRQGAVVGAALVIALLILAGLYQFAVHRNDTAAAGGDGVPITEVTDVTDQGDESKQLPMPPLQFQYDGHPQAMRNFIVEAGATPPPGAPAPAPPAQNAR